MTIAYKFTRCKSITFAKDEKYLEDFSLPVITIDENTENFSEISNCNEPEVVIKIKLGVKTKGNFIVPINTEEKFVMNDDDDDDTLIELINLILKGDANNIKKQMSDKVVLKYADWLKKHFNAFTSHNCQQCIIDLLNAEDSLVAVPSFEEVTRDVITTIPIFSDIKIVENDKDTNISNKNYVKEKLTQNSIQNSTQLEAFGKNKFTVIYGRKQANIPNTIRNQNYGVIDSLARNGVICSPETRNKLSIEILIEKLSKLNAFHIVIIHPSYLLKYNSSTYPCENIEPSYKLNEGEILAVFYRYICIHFFGYCEIHDENDNEWKYNI